MPDPRSAIIQTIQSIPKGQLSSYGKIAKAAGYPGYARYVGFVLKTLPEPTKLPWHRVVNAQGKISFPQGSEKFLEQQRRLVLEGHPNPLTRSHFCKVAWPDSLMLPAR